MAILKIKQPNGSWAIVGDTSETIKFTEQQLTEEQKKVARENVGAGRTTLMVNDEEIEIYTPIGTQGSATGAELFNDYYYNQASGEYSHAEGFSTEAAGARSHAEGDTTHATAIASHAEGADTHAEGIASHAEGYGTCATGDYAHAEGYTSEASGDYSHAEGYHTTASESYSHAEGEETTASGCDSHAEGYSCHAQGQCSHAEGHSSWAEGDYSHAEGCGRTRAEGEGSHAEGCGTTASGYYSHAEGYSCDAYGTQSHAEGYHTSTTGAGAHAEGQYTIAAGSYQHVQGKFNIEDTENKYAHIVGNGEFNQTNNANHLYSNAHTLDWQGNAWFAGDVYVGSASGKDKDAGSKRLARIDEVASIEILETPKDGEILVYDAASNKLVNSGFTISSLQQWVRDYVNTYISTEYVVQVADDGMTTLVVTGDTKEEIDEAGNTILYIGGR